MDKGTKIRTTLLLFALINTSLQLLGFSVLPFTAEEVEAFLTVVLNVIAAIVAWWKNNDVTDEAKQGTELTRKLKGEK